MRSFVLGSDTPAQNFRGDNTSHSVTLNGNTCYELNADGGLRLANVATASLPAAPTEGTIFYDSTTKTIKVWNGSSYDTYGLASNNLTQKFVWAKDMFLASTSNPAALAESVTGGSNFGFQHFAFDDSSAEYAYFNVFMPDEYSGGTLTASIYWAPSGTDTGDVQWIIHKALATGSGDTLLSSGTAGSYTPAQAGSGTANELHITTPGDLQLNNSWSAGDILQFHVRRNGSAGTDTFTGDANLLGVLLDWS